MFFFLQTQQIKMQTTCDLLLKIHYWTQPGQYVAICGSNYELGSWQPQQAPRFFFLGGGHGKKQKLRDA